MLIKELLSRNEIIDSYPLMKQLRTDLTEESYLNLINDMKGQGYRLIALFNEDLKIISLVGFTILTNLYYLKHIWIYDLITDQLERSKGNGELLLRHIEQIARENECSCVALSSGLERIDAHRFYQNKLNYNKSSYVLKKVIE